MKTKLKQFAPILALVAIVGAVIATDLSYDPAAPQTGDSELIIQHKTAVNIAAIASSIEGAIAGNGGAVTGTGTAGTADAGVLTVQGIASMTPLAVTPAATESQLGFTGTSRTILSPTVTVDAGAYQAGDVVGGKLTLTSAMRVSGGTGKFETLTVIEKGTQAAVLDVLIFDADPAAGTYTDAAALTVHDTDAGKLIQRVHVAAADYVSTGGYGVASIPLNLTLKASGSANLFAIITTSGTPTYSATSSLKVRFGIQRD